MKGEKLIGNLGNSVLAWPDCSKTISHQFSFFFKVEGQADKVGGLKEVERDVGRGGGGFEGMGCRSGNIASMNLLKLRRSCRFQLLLGLWENGIAWEGLGVDPGRVAVHQPSVTRIGIQLVNLL